MRSSRLSRCSLSPMISFLYSLQVRGPLSIPFAQNSECRLIFLIAHVSRDGRDLVILATETRALLVRDFESICRGETTLEEAGQVLRLLPRDVCYYLAFEHGRICVATVRISPRFSYLRVPMFLCLFYNSIRGSTFLSSTEAILSIRSSSCSCDPSSTMRLRRGTGSPVCSSLTDAYTLRGKIRDVGTSHSSKKRRMS